MVLSYPERVETSVLVGDCSECPTPLNILISLSHLALVLICFDPCSSSVFPVESFHY